jgi:hypothetical protein
MSVRVLVADRPVDGPRGSGMRLANEPDIEVVTKAGSGPEAIDLTARDPS